MPMGRQWIGVALGVVAGAAIAVGVVVWLARGSAGQASTVPKRETPLKSEVQLQRGTPLELVLLRPLHSGDVEEGERAALVLTNDVLANGQVAIPAGTTVLAEVVRSREGSVMSSLVNQPARLEVQFLPLEIDGISVLLCTSIEDPDAPMELTRATASRSEAGEALKSLWDHPETQKFLKDLTDRMNGENLGEDFDDPDSMRILNDVSSQLGMKATERFGAKGTSVGAMLAATDKVARGSFESMDAAEALLAIQAVSELGRLAVGVDRGLRGAIKGRNIKIPIGTRMTVFVAEDVTISP